MCMLCSPINLYYHLFRSVEAGTATANTEARSHIEW